MDQVIEKYLDIRIPWEVCRETLVKVPCLLCGAEGQAIGSVVLNDVESKVRRCEGDGLMWLSPRPDAGFYDDLYGKHFYSSTCSEQYGYAQVHEEQRRREKAVKNWDDIERATLQPLRRERFLEIGCSTGEMLDEAVKRGWKEVVGNELSGVAAEQCVKKGHRVVQGDFSLIDASSPFNLIFADNVIEHLMDPLSFARQMARLLSKNGVLCLRLPNTPPEGPRLKLIDHTFHFNPQSLAALLAKGGLHVENVIDSGLYRGSEGKTILNMTVFSTLSTQGA
jgi:SAM-dependent methyltransferase